MTFRSTCFAYYAAFTFTVEAEACSVALAVDDAGGRFNKGNLLIVWIRRYLPCDFSTGIELQNWKEANVTAASSAPTRLEMEHNHFLDCHSGACGPKTISNHSSKSKKQQQQKNPCFHIHFYLMPLLSFSFGLKAKILASDFGFGIPQRMRCFGVNFHMASFVYHFAILFLGDFFFLVLFC